MKKIIMALVLMLLAPLMVLVNTPAANAACISTVNMKSDYALVADDEDRAYVRFWSKIYFYDCGSYRTLRYTQIGYAPDTRYNSSLSCNSLIIDKVQMNQGSILGNDPGNYTFECASGGALKTYDWTNESISSGSTWDRGFGVHWVVNRSVFADPSGDVPYNSF